MEPGRARGRELQELALLFLRLGATSFGGPAAHIAMFEDEVVRRRGWLTRAEFLDLLAVTNMIPGPNSTEMAIHIGRRRAGWAGLLVAGACFILPATTAVLLLAWAYVRFGTLPEVGAVLAGIKPVLIAILLQALVGFAHGAVRSVRLALLGVAALAAQLLGVDELAVLAGAGIAGLVLVRAGRAPLALALCCVPAGATLAAVPFGLGKLFLVFLEIGSVLFGSGYVLLSFLRAEFVERLHWLTETQLLDAVAVGQATPGPLFTTATFIGYLLGGLPGGIVATVGIFLPAFVFVAISGPLVRWMRGSPASAAFLDGVVVASLALMVGVTLRLGKAALVDATSIGVAAVAAVLLLRFRVGSSWLVLGGALVGWVVAR